MPASVLTVVGARPQFVKAASVSRAIATSPGLREILVHTGQHFDANMSDVFFSELSIPEPQFNLGISGGNHGAMTAQMLTGLEDLMLAYKPDIVLVYGDTNSTLAGALAASKLSICVAHVEAGLRSFNRTMPEEVNRVLTDHISDVLFCPTRHAVANLQNEGIVRGVHQVGDVMFDSTLYAVQKAADMPSILDELGLEMGGFVLATVHRADNTASAEALLRVIDFVRAQSGGLPVVLPLHPRTRAAAAQFGVNLSGITVVDPVSYFHMTQLLQGCALVMTDSGGLQKEAYFHRRPAITLRSETEWVETVEAGWNRLWTQDAWLERREIAEYGDGNSATRIVAELEAMVA